MDDKCATDRSIAAKFARLVAENPDLPVKVCVIRELSCDPNERYIGKLYDCEVAEYVEYGAYKCVYFERDDDELRYDVWNCVWNERRDEIDKTVPKAEPDFNKLHLRYQEVDRLTHESLSEEEHNRLTDQRIAELDWKPCICLGVGP